MKISVKRIERILNEMPKIIIEEENNSWGAVTPREKEVVEPGSVMYYINKHLKEKKNAKSGK